MIAAVAESAPTTRWRDDPRHANTAIGIKIVYRPVTTGMPAIFVYPMTSGIPSAARVMPATIAGFSSDRSIGNTPSSTGSRRVLPLVAISAFPSDGSRTASFCQPLARCSRTTPARGDAHSRVARSSRERPGVYSRCPPRDPRAMVRRPQSRGRTAAGPSPWPLDRVGVSPTRHDDVRRLH